MKKLICLCMAICILALSPGIPVFASNVTKSNADIVIKVGEKYKLEAVLDYFVKNRLPVSIKPKWETSDSSIAKVSGGTVTGVSPGGVVIRASATNNGVLYRAEATVYVISSVTGVTLNTDSIQLQVGQTEKLVERVLPADAVLKTVKWKSEDSKIATVSGGTVKGVSEGTTYITVTTNDGGYTAQCLVRVASSVTGVRLTDHSLTKYVGEEFNLSYTVQPANAFLKEVKWSSSDSKVASVSNGKVKALSKGTAIIKVQTVDGKYTDECVIKVDGMVTGVSLNKTYISLPEGTTETLFATITPASAIEKSVTWKSEDTKVAKVSSSGVVTAVKEGMTTIIVTTKDGRYQAEAEVEVTAVTRNIRYVESIDLIDSNLSLKVGETYWLQYKIYPADLVPKLTVSCKSIENNDSLPVSIKNNMVYLDAKKAGEYKLILSEKDRPQISDSCTVKVTSTVTGIEISKTQIELYIGDKYQLTANALPATALVKGVTWKSSNSSVATINTSTGEVTAKGEGECTITASTIDGEYKKTCKVTVKNPVDIKSIQLVDEQGNVIGDSPAVIDNPSQTTAPEPKELSITVDGVPLTMDQPPILTEGRVLAPVRAIFEALGISVHWNEELKLVTGISGDTVIQLTIDETKAYVNSQMITLDVPATIVNTRTLVPVRFIAESTGVKVDWDESTRTVIITTK